MFATLSSESSHDASAFSFALRNLPRAEPLDRRCETQILHRTRACARVIRQSLSRQLECDRFRSKLQRKLQRIAADCSFWAGLPCRFVRRGTIDNH
jgi:hypothetical protein